MENLKESILLTFAAVSLLAVYAIIMALPTQWLWNTCLVPSINSVNPIGFWQALGINVLCSILFKGSSSPKKND